MDWRRAASRRTVPELYRVLLETGRFSDVTFVVGQERLFIRSHTFILVTRSSVFEAMFSDSWLPGTKRDSLDGSILVEVPDTEADTFRAFLQFLYTDNTEGCLNPLGVLYLAQKYDVVELVGVCSALLAMSLHVPTVIPIYQAAKLFDLTQLQEAAMDFMLRNAASVVQHKDFLSLDSTTLSEFLSSDSLQLDEVGVFKSLLTWANRECERQGVTPSTTELRRVLGKAVTLARFPLMSPENFATEVVGCGLLEQEEVISLFLHLSLSPEKRTRLPPLSFNASPRNYAVFKKKSGISTSFSVGLYLGSEPVSPQSLSCTMGSVGRMYEETLDFIVNRDVEILGLGLFGPSAETLLQDDTCLTYNVQMSIFSYNVNQQRTVVVRGSQAVTTRKDYDVRFAHPVKVFAGKLHHIRLAFQGEETKHGFSRLSNVSTVCGKEKVKFHFVGPIGTEISHPEGRIRSLIFIIR